MVADCVEVVASGVCAALNIFRTIYICIYNTLQIKINQIVYITCSKIGKWE